MLCIVQRDNRVGHNTLFCMRFVQYSFVTDIHAVHVLVWGTTLRNLIYMYNNCCLKYGNGLFLQCILKNTRMYTGDKNNYYHYPCSECKVYKKQSTHQPSRYGIYTGTHTQLTQQIVPPFHCLIHSCHHLCTFHLRCLLQGPTINSDGVKKKPSHSGSLSSHLQLLYCYNFSQWLFAYPAVVPLRVFRVLGPSMP